MREMIRVGAVCVARMRPRGAMVTCSHFATPADHDHAAVDRRFCRQVGPGGSSFALNEEQGAQQHFVELCAVLGVPAPVGGDDYLFEKNTLVLGSRHGYADAFKRGFFAWENKAPGKPIDAALRQLMTYALALDNPPLLIVSDRLRIEIHTHFNGTPSERHVVMID